MLESFKKDNNLLKTLNQLKQSATKLKENPPEDKPEPVQKQKEGNPFYNEFEACLSKIKDKSYVVDRAQERTVDIIDKVSIDEIMRKYNHDYGRYFRYPDKSQHSGHIQKTVKKILEKPDLDEDQKVAMQEFCKPIPMILNNVFQCDLCDENPMTKKQLEMHKIEYHENFEKECCGKR